MQQIETPYSSPYLSSYGYPNNVPGGQKNSKTKKKLDDKKKLEDTNVLIPFQHSCYLTITGYGYFLGALMPGLTSEEPIVNLATFILTIDTLKVLL